LIREGTSPRCIAAKVRGQGYRRPSKLGADQLVLTSADMLRRTTQRWPDSPTFSTHPAQRCLARKPCVAANVSGSSVRMTASPCRLDYDPTVESIERYLHAKVIVLRIQTGEWCTKLTVDYPHDISKFRGFNRLPL
jgi:hypothetical protein